MVDYLPTQVGESTAKITSNSLEFGNIVHELKLISKQAKPSSPTNFHSALGSAQTQSIKFQSYAKTRTEYTCKLENPDFSCEKLIIAPLSQGPCELMFDVVFEPSFVGTYKTLLTISSTLYGDYEFVLHGTCTEPQVQGPLMIKSGQPFTLSFRNVFHVNGTYTFTIDNPCFSVKCPESIAARKVGHVVVSYAAGKEKSVNTSKTGKLVITNTVSNTQWTFYMKEQQ